MHVYFFNFSCFSRCRTRINSSHTIGGLPRLNCTSLAFRVFSSMSAKYEFWLYLAYCASSRSFSSRAP